MLNFLNPIFNFGINGASNELQKHIRLTNQSTLILVSGSSPFIVIFLLMGLPVIGFSLIPVQFFFLLTFFLNKKKLINLARLNLLLIANLATFFYSMIFGESAGVQLLYFCFVTLPLVIFSSNERKKSILGFLTPLVLYFVSYLLDFNLFAFQTLDPYQSSLVFYTVSFVVFAISYLCINFVLKENRTYSDSLKETNHTLEEKNKFLEDTNNALLSAQKEVDEKKKLEIEFELAKDAQAEFLPAEMPRIKGYKFEKFFQGARGVSGDYYDYACFGHTIKFFVADVMSKSFSAGFITAHLYSLFRSYVKKSTRPQALVKYINKMFVDGRNHWEKAGIIALDLDTKTGELILCNAAIGIVYFISQNQIKEIETSGFYIGADKKQSYEEVKMMMKKGDILFIASDGLEDMRDNDRTRYKPAQVKEELEKALKKRKTDPDYSITTHFESVVKNYQNDGFMKADDIVLITIERQN